MNAIITPALLLAAVISSTHPAPDPRLTPGAMAAGVTVDDVCRRAHYAEEARARLTAATKEKVWRAYGVPHPDRPGYRLDHYFPIEAGGCADCAGNLWPQPAADAKLKDRLEARLHRDLCAVPPRIRLSDVPGLVKRGW